MMLLVRAPQPLPRGSLLARLHCPRSCTLTVGMRSLPSLTVRACDIMGRYGYNTAVLNAAIVEDAPGSVLNNIELSTVEQEVATGIMLFSAMIASLTGSGPCDKYGRKRCLLWCVGGVCMHTLLLALTAWPQE